MLVPAADKYDFSVKMVPCVRRGSVCALTNVDRRTTMMYGRGNVILQHCTQLKVYRVNVCKSALCGYVI